jgi:hypothetical protein
MKQLLLLLFIPVMSMAQQKPFVITKAALQNKIKGGWAGQTIGVTFGGPIEFRYCGTMVEDSRSFDWYSGYLKKTMQEIPGLYDDIYMDLTFVNVFEKYGMNVSVDSFANAYAHAGYLLWHANQAGRYNILHGLKAPASGHWHNNPHADDIDYQIESDFAGLMSPAMPNAASDISNKIGHIMNYGDGWYGGVYMGAMYSIAFTSSDISFIVTEALKTVPKQSDFHKCMLDVINWHKKYPTDWKQTWFELQRKWADETGCPDGVFQPFNIDAKINAAYVVLGLLYGNGDFTRTMQITTRCGQDADCNPSSAGGILGTILGYDNIPLYWKQGLAEIENIDFKFTTLSLNKIYEIGLKHALKNIQMHGGKIDGEKINIPQENVKTVAYEKSFDGHYPLVKIELNKNLKKKGDELSFEFEGIGYVVRGETAKWAQTGDQHSFVFEIEVYLDGNLLEKADLPVNYDLRRHDLLAYKYSLPKGKHTVTIKLLNEKDGEEIKVRDAIVYDNKKSVVKY